MQENNIPTPVQDPVQPQTPPATMPTIEPQLSSTPPVPEAPVVPVAPAQEIKKPKFPKRIVLIVLGVVVLIVIIAVIALFATKGLKGVTDLIPMASGSPTPTPFVEVVPASPYENDPEVLKIKADLEAFDAKLNGTSVREDTLRIPVLEWNVDFKK